MKSYHSIEYPMFFSIAFSYTSCATRASKIPIPTDLKQRVSLCVCGRPLCVSSDLLLRQKAGFQRNPQVPGLLAGVRKLRVNLCGQP